MTEKYQTIKSFGNRKLSEKKMMELMEKFISSEEYQKALKDFLHRMDCEKIFEALEEEDQSTINPYYKPSYPKPKPHPYLPNRYYQIGVGGVKKNGMHKTKVLSKL